MSRAMRRLLAAAFLAGLVVAAYLLWLGGPAKTLRINDYISDEVWYVSSAVNVARKILGLHIVPRVNTTHAVYTVFYDNTSCSMEEAVGEARSAAPGLAVEPRSYSKIAAFSAIVPLSEAERLEGLTGRGCIVDVMPGRAPDHKGINNYLNTEHPPLAKYVLALVLYLRGWSPAAWRLPSYAMGLLVLVSTAAAGYLAARELARGGPGARIAAVMLAALPGLVALEDPALRSMSGVAMLDIYVAGLDAVAVALLARGRWLASALAAGLAGSAKYTGLFLLPIYILALPPRRAAAAAAAALAVVAASWAPFAAVMGPGWVLGQVAFAASWHTTSRPPGPPSTNPLGLVTGRDGFVLYYLDGEPFLVAVCNPGLCIAGLAAAAAAAVTVAADRCRGRRPMLLYTSAASPLAAWLGYVAVYAAGNHTLYSFYSVQLSALSAAALPAAPLLVDEAARALWLPRCLASPEAAPLRRSMAAAAGFAAALWLAGGAPAWPLRPLELAPLYSMIPWDKPSRLAFAAAGLLVYTAAAYRLGGSAARWLAAGLAAYSGPAAPLAAVAAALPGAGLAEALLAGVSLPLAVVLAAPGPRAAAGIAAGYALALAAALAGGARPGGIWMPWSLAAAASLLASPMPRRIRLAAAAAMEPSLLPLLALEGGGYSAAAAAAGLGAAAGAWWLLAAGLVAAAVLASVESLPLREDKRQRNHDHTHSL